MKTEGVYALEFNPNNKLKRYHVDTLERTVHRNQRYLFAGRPIKWHIVLTGTRDECKAEMRRLGERK
jgi:hypothetical protein